MTNTKEEIIPTELLAAWTGEEGATRLLILGLVAAGLLGVALLAWFFFVRRGRRKRKRIHRPHHWQLEPGESRATYRRRRRERRRRSAHPRLPMNPTLAETGGLPPRRSEDQPPAGV